MLQSSFTYGTFIRVVCLLSVFGTYSEFQSTSSNVVEHFKSKGSETVLRILNLGN
jgi:hypothetical protein